MIGRLPQPPPVTDAAPKSCHPVQERVLPASSCCPPRRTRPGLSLVSYPYRNPASPVGVVRGRPWACLTVGDCSTVGPSQEKSLPWKELHSAPMGEARNPAISPSALGSHFQMHLGPGYCLWGKLGTDSEENEMLAREPWHSLCGERNWGRACLVWSASNTVGLRMGL